MVSLHNIQTLLWMTVVFNVINKCYQVEHYDEVLPKTHSGLWKIVGIHGNKRKSKSIVVSDWMLHCPALPVTFHGAEGTVISTSLPISFPQPPTCQQFLYEASWWYACLTTLSDDVHSWCAEEMIHKQKGIY